MTYVRPVHGDPFADGSATDLTVVLGALSDGLEAVAVFNVRDYGAVGDGVADDTAEVQDALTACPSGSAVVIPGGVFKISAGLTVPAGVTVTGAGTVSQVTAATPAFDITTSGVTIRGITITGPGNGTAVSGSDAIRLSGTAGVPLAGARIQDVTISEFSFYGIYAKYVTDLSVSRCEIREVGYAGILCVVCVGGRIDGCLVDTVSPGSVANAYGIALTSLDGVSPGGCTDFVVSGNTVRNVTIWEGLDTHGGSRITFSSNVVESCYIGIAIVPGDVLSGQEPPTDVVVSGNVVDSGVTDGSMATGISFAGTTGVLYDGTGIICNNTIRGHGLQSSGTAAAIVCRNTSGLVVSGNVIWEPSPAGIRSAGWNKSMVIVGNFIHDAWTNDYTVASGIFTHISETTGIMVGNVGVVGGKSATYTNGRGIWNGNEVSNKFQLVGNDFSTWDLPVLSPTTGFALQGFYETPAVVKPTVTGSRGGNAALADLLTELATLGLITDSTS